MLALSIIGLLEFFVKVGVSIVVMLILFVLVPSISWFGATLSTRLRMLESLTIVEMTERGISDAEANAQNFDGLGAGKKALVTLVGKGKKRQLKKAQKLQDTLLVQGPLLAKIKNEFADDYRSLQHMHESINAKTITKYVIIVYVNLSFFGYFFIPLNILDYFLNGPEEAGGGVLEGLLSIDIVELIVFVILLVLVFSKSLRTLYHSDFVHPFVWIKRWFKGLIDSIKLDVKVNPALPISVRTRYQLKWPSTANRLKIIYDYIASRGIRIPQPLLIDVKVLYTFGVMVAIDIVLIVISVSSPIFGILLFPIVLFHFVYVKQGLEIIFAILAKQQKMKVEAQL
jgi:hypothetical protein